MTGSNQAIVQHCYFASGFRRKQLYYRLALVNNVICNQSRHSPQ